MAYVAPNSTEDLFDRSISRLLPSSIDEFEKMRWSVDADTIPFEECE
jgi:hypothetical protein